LLPVKKKKCRKKEVGRAGGNFKKGVKGLRVGCDGGDITVQPTGKSPIKENWGGSNSAGDSTGKEEVPKSKEKRTSIQERLPKRQGKRELKKKKIYASPFSCLWPPPKKEGKKGGREEKTTTT